MFGGVPYMGNCYELLCLLLARLYLVSKNISNFQSTPSTPSTPCSFTTQKGKPLKCLSWTKIKNKVLVVGFAPTLGNLLTHRHHWHHWLWTTPAQLQPACSLSQLVVPEPGSNMVQLHGSKWTSGSRVRWEMGSWGDGVMGWWVSCSELLATQGGAQPSFKTWPDKWSPVTAMRAYPNFNLS